MPHAPTSRFRRAFTLIDLMMTIVVIGIVTVVVAPMLAPQEALCVIAAGTVLVADIEYAQSATLSDPADPTLVRFNEKGLGYWLARASDPETPIQRPGSEKAYEVIFGEGDAKMLAGVTIDASAAPDSTIAFDAFGRLSGLTDVKVVMDGTNGSVEISVTANTGSVRMVTAGGAADPGD